MARLERAWMTFGIAMFLLQLVSLVSDAAVVVSLLVFGLFLVGCVLSFATLFKLVHHFTQSTNTKVIKYQVQHDKRTKAETYLRKVLGEHDEDEVDQKSQEFS
jgi:hypothetical protein